MYLLLLSVSLMLQNLHPSVITTSFVFTSNNTLGTYCSVYFTVIIQISIFLWWIFGGQKIGGKFGHRHQLAVYFNLTCVMPIPGNTFQTSYILATNVTIKQ